jgi:hypothetical protein
VYWTTCFEKGKPADRLIQQVIPRLEAAQQFILVFELMGSGRRTSLKTAKKTGISRIVRAERP